MRSSKRALAFFVLHRSAVLKAVYGHNEELCGADKMGIAYVM